MNSQNGKTNELVFFDLNIYYISCLGQIQPAHVLTGNNSTVTAIDFDNEGVRLFDEGF
jgi:hypothetical protein